jgi:hypothetical protein
MDTLNPAAGSYLLGGCILRSELGHLDRTWLSASCPAYPRSRPLERTSRFGSFVPTSEVTVH